MFAWVVKPSDEPFTMAKLPLATCVSVCWPDFQTAVLKNKEAIPKEDSDNP